jgi:hypothetical protein
MVPGALAPLAAWRAWDDYSVARALTKSALPFTIVDLPRRSYLVRGWGYVAVGEVGAAVVGLRVSGWPPIGQIRTLAMVWTGVAIMLAGTLGAVFAFNAWQATVPGGRIVVPGGGAI